MVRPVFLHSSKRLWKDINNEHNMDTVSLNDKRECLLWTLVRVDAISNFSWMKTRLKDDMFAGSIGCSVFYLLLIIQLARHV